MTDYFFDFDGTIADSQPDIRKAYLETFRHFNLPMGDFDRRFRVGPPLSAMIRTVMPSADDELCEKAAALFREIYDSSGFPLTLPYPGIKELLLRLKNGGKNLYILTNKRSIPTNLCLEKFGFSDFFDEIICCDSCPGLRNKGELLEYTVRENSLTAEDTVMIGDMASDIEAGHFAGVRTAGVCWGYGNEAELIEAAPDMLIHSPEELV